MTDLVFKQETKKKYPPTAQAFDDWRKDNPQYMAEFKKWKRETDLTHVELYGLRFAVQTFGFIDWLTWKLQSELNEVTEETTEDAQFEEIAIC